MQDVYLLLVCYYARRGRRFSQLFLTDLNNLHSFQASAIASSLVRPSFLCFPSLFFSPFLSACVCVGVLIGKRELGEGREFHGPAVARNDIL